MARKQRPDRSEVEATGGKVRSRRSKEKELPRTTKSAEARIAKINVVPQTDNQQHLLDTLNSKMLTIVVGPAGSGKTYLSAYAAAKALSLGEVSNIFVTRTMVTVGKDIGFLPGSETEKMLPYVAPIIEYFAEFFGKEEVAKMIKANVIRVVPIALLRGYTFKDTFVILDEAQNTTPHEFKTIITRMGDGSKMVVLGDLDQSDLKGHKVISGPEDFVRRMHEENEHIGFAKLTEDDIRRSDLVRDIVKIYKQEYVDGEE